MKIAADDGTGESTGVVRATINRVVMLGFEVRVELTNAATGGPFTAQITRGDAEALGLKEGDTVYVRATRVPPIPGEALPPSDAGADAAKDGTKLSSA
jgi:sulfate/thiosulfate transport system ATP-binding protein